MLLAIVSVYQHIGTTDLTVLSLTDLNIGTQRLL
jgi:hypothetical protein